MKPSGVTTNLVRMKSAPGITSLPEETSREGLCDLVEDYYPRETAGSMLHNGMAV